MAIKNLRASLVGMRFYSPPFDVYERIASTAPFLQTEPNNSHDKDAVAVLLQGYKIGYLDKESASRVAPLLRSRTELAIKVGAISNRTIKLSLSYKTDNLIAKAPQPTGGRVCGIYKLSIKFGQYVYVGQASSINRRLKSHWIDLAAQAHPNKHLQRYWNRFGEEAFAAEIVEELPAYIPSGLARQEWLGEREGFWIAYYRSQATCLNILDGEVIATKDALTDIKKANKAHDDNVRSQKQTISALLERLESQRAANQSKILDLESEARELQTFIKKNSGIVGFVFGNRSKTVVDHKKRMLESVKKQLDRSREENTKVLDQVKALKQKRRSLKTSKQLSGGMSGRAPRAGSPLKH